jgi:ABC-2 type transport system permease protein
MKWRLYKEALLLGLSEVVNYRADMWFQVASKVISLTSLGILWWWLLVDAGASTKLETASYLLIANGVREIVDSFYMKFAGKMMDEIKDGSISMGLIRPVSPYRLSYFIFSGSRGVNYIFGGLLIALGMYIFPASNIINYFYFVIILLLANLISYYMNLLVGFISFWIVEGANFRGLFIHTARVLSGAMIPVSYFPGIMKDISLLSPFPVLAYLPAKVLQNGLGGYEWSIMAAIGWLIIMIYAEKIIWNYGLKKYEAIGI